MTEHDLSSDSPDMEELGFLRLLGYLDAQSEAPGGPVHERRVTGRVGSRDREQQPRLFGQALDPAQEVLPDPARQRKYLRQPEATCQLGHRTAARQL